MAHAHFTGNVLLVEHAGSVRGSSSFVCASSADPTYGTLVSACMPKDMNQWYSREAEVYTVSVLAHWVEY
jgi:hypothetical protein